MTRLEDRYRRLLSWYPAEHRDRHEQEMLDVLMARARPGQTRPTLAEALDLRRGALRIRWQRRPTATSATWRDALAIASFVAVVLLLAEGLRFAVSAPVEFHYLAHEYSGGHNYSGNPLLAFAFYYGTAPFWLAWTVLAVLLWRGNQRAAAVGARWLSGILLFSVYVGMGWWDSLPQTANVPASLAGTPLLLTLLATLGMTFSAGPRHGASLLGRRRAMVLVTMVAGLAVLTSEGVRYLWFDVPADSDYRLFDTLAKQYSWTLLGALALVGVVAGTWLGRTAAGRRACVVLAAVTVPLVLQLMPTALYGYSVDVDAQNYFEMLSYSELPLDLVKLAYTPQTGPYDLPLRIGPITGFVFVRLALNVLAGLVPALLFVRAVEVARGMRGRRASA